MGHDVSYERGTLGVMVGRHLVAKQAMGRLYRGNGLAGSERAQGCTVKAEETRNVVVESTDCVETKAYGTRGEMRLSAQGEEVTWGWRRGSDVGEWCREEEKRGLTRCSPQVRF